MSGYQCLTACGSRHSSDAGLHPVPAILEYIPYRKRDGTRAWDDPRHHWWAGRGYAAIRLDIRGIGESEGIIVDEFASQEQDDAVAAIAWIAQQTWCNGNVGMTGISWGGFNSLQVAARRPPALKAIITHCSTDDRYADDVHYMGGCLLVENFYWGASFLQFMARPGDPQIQGARWRDQWHQRLKSWEPVASTEWLEHQRRDEYWKHGSTWSSPTALVPSSQLLRDNRCRRSPGGSRIATENDMAGTSKSVRRCGFGPQKTPLLLIRS